VLEVLEYSSSGKVPNHSVIAHSFPRFANSLLIISSFHTIPPRFMTHLPKERGTNQDEED